MFKPLTVEATMSPDVHTHVAAVSSSHACTVDCFLAGVWFNEIPFWTKNENVTFLVSGEDWTDAAQGTTHTLRSHDAVLLSCSSAQIRHF